MPVRGVVRGAVRGAIRSAVQPVGTGAGGVVVYLQDTFTDTNGTALTSHTMNIGPGWVGYGSQFFDIQSNATREQFGNPGYVASDAGASDGVFRVTISAAGGQVVVRGSDATNFIYALNATSTAISITKQVAGADTLINNAAVSALSYPATFRITLSGNNITMLDEASLQSVSGTDTFNNTATRHGFRAQTALITYDNFSFQSA